MARFILIGLYTGTRHTAILRLKWMASLSGGCVDLTRGVLYRRGDNERETAKRRPPVRLSARLQGHLLRWQVHDLRHGMSNIVHYHGRPIAKMKRAWAAVVKESPISASGYPIPHSAFVMHWRTICAGFMSSPICAMVGSGGSGGTKAK